MLKLKLGSHQHSTYKQNSHKAASHLERRRCSLDRSEDNNSNFYGLFGCDFQGIPFSQSTSISINSHSTIESTKPACQDIDCVRAADGIEGLEMEYNYLISQNENRDTNHFTILNENVRTLINKKLNQRHFEKAVKIFSSTLDNGLSEEVSLGDLTQILNNPPPCYYPISKHTNDAVARNHEWTQQYSPAPHHPTNNDASSEDDCAPAHNIIPDKFRKKKLPHLDKKIRTGYIKFFDDRNNFGFMNLLTEPFGEVFIFGREFEKSGVDPKIIGFASNNTEVVFKFRVMYYMGKHGESKKAVNIRLSDC